MANQPQGLNGFNPLSYMGVNPSTPSNYKSYNRAPTENDSQNFLIGSWWLFPNITTDPPTARLFNLIALVGGRATWAEVTFGGANEFVTDNGTAFPLAGVLNVLGIDGVTTIGDGNTVTITTDGTVATEYAADVGTAIPDDGIIQILGGANINTSAATNIVTVNLDESIFLPATTALATAGMYRLGGVDFMHAFGTQNAFLGSAAGNRTLTGTRNTAVGSAALTSDTTGSDAVAVGNLALTLNTTGTSNTAVGSESMRVNLTSGSNVAVGTSSMQAITSGTGQNAAVGVASLGNVTTGSNNIAIGYHSGLSYTTTESSNIVIGSSGTITDSNTIRIGTEGAGLGQQNTTYCAGIYSGTLGATNKVTMVDSTGKLAGSTGTNGQVLIGATAGSPAWSTITAGANITVTNAANSITIASTGGGGGVAAQPFYAYLDGDDINTTGSGNGYRFGTNKALTTQYDLSGGFYPGSGAGAPATFTAPFTGYYVLNMTAQMTWPMGSSHLLVEFYFGPSAGPGGPSWFGFQEDPPFDLASSPVTGLLSTFAQVSLTAGQVVSFIISVTGASNDVTLVGAGAVGVYTTSVGGYRIA